MRGGWALVKGRGSSARRVEMGGEGDENDGMLRVGKRGARWNDIRREDRERKGVERGGYAVSWGIRVQSVDYYRRCPDGMSRPMT